MREHISNEDYREDYNEFAVIDEELNQWIKAQNLFLVSTMKGCNIRWIFLDETYTWKSQLQVEAISDTPNFIVRPVFRDDGNNTRYMWEFIYEPGKEPLTPILDKALYYLRNYTLMPALVYGGQN